MHRLLLLFLMVVSGCGVNSHAAPAVLRLDRTEVDLGNVPAEEAHEAEPVLRNVGGSDLVISQLSSSCKCTAAIVTAARITPGGRATLRLQTRPDARGENRAVVVIHSNSEGGSSNKVSIRWRAISPVDAVPPRIDFGTLRPGADAQIPFSLVGRPSFLGDGQVYTVRRIGPTGTEINCDLKDGDFTDVISGLVSVNSDRISGDYSRILRFEVTGGWSGILEVPIRWRVRDPITAVPSRLFLGRGEPGQMLQGQVTIRAAEGKLAIETVDVAGGNWRPDVEQAVTEDGALRFDITALLPSRVGIYRCELRCTFRSPGHTLLSIPISAAVQTRGDLP